MRKTDPLIRYTPESLIKRMAYDIGFSEVGIAGVDPSPESNVTFERWLAAGWHADMTYLSGGRDKRRTPGLLLEGARSAVCVALNYYCDECEQDNRESARAGRGIVSLYAQGRDYHIVMEDMLGRLDRGIKELFPDMRSRICVDTQPISERDFAIRAGIGWLGKNTMVISPEYGSWIFLAELITDLDLAVDTPLESMCGSCTRCMDACPTGALDKEFSLDATRCISYLTIEKRGNIAPEWQSAIGRHLFGCDDCQQVCPFNAAPQETKVFGLDERNPISTMRLEDLSRLSDDEYRALMQDSALRRAKPSGMRRNARIVLQNIRRGGAAG